jgi:hypothetical protein
MFADNKIVVFLETFASWHKQFNSLLGGAIRLLFVMIFLRAFLFQGICSFDCDIYMCTWANATLFVGGCGATSASSREHHEFTAIVLMIPCATREAVGSLTSRRR